MAFMLLGVPFGFAYDVMLRPGDSPWLVYLTMVECIVVTIGGL